MVSFETVRQLAHADETELGDPLPAPGRWLARTVSRPASSPTKSQPERPRSVAAPSRAGRPAGCTGTTGTSRGPCDRDYSTVSSSSIPFARCAPCPTGQ